MTEMLEKALYSAADLVAKTEGKEMVEKVLSEKEQEIVSMVLDIQQNDFIKKIAIQWDKLSEKDKMDLYNKWEQSIWASMKRVSWTSLMTGNLFSFLPRADRFRKNIFNNFTPAVRIFVHLGILSRPAWLDDDQIHKNIIADRKGIKRQLFIIKWACAVVPQLRPALPIVQRLSPLITLSADAQENILHAVTNTMEHDHVVAVAQQDLYKNVSTDASTLWTQVEATHLSDEVKQVA
jgi:hypothetical protein